MTSLYDSMLAFDAMPNPGQQSRMSSAAPNQSISMSVSIVIADDHEVVKEGLRSLLSQCATFEVVGEAAHGREAVAVVTAKQPDVCIIDVTMPEMNGIEATNAIRQCSSDTKVIGLSMHNDPVLIAGMFNAGACGYVCKDSAFSEIVAAVESVTRGDPYFGRGVSSVVLAHYRALIADAEIADDTLTSAERQVLQLIAEGLREEDIAEQLGIRLDAVEVYRDKIMHKLNLYTVAELTKYAVRHGITSLVIRLPRRPRVQNSS